MNYSWSKRPLQWTFGTEKRSQESTDKKISTQILKTGTVDSPYPNWFGDHVRIP